MPALALCLAEDSDRAALSVSGDTRARNSEKAIRVQVMPSCKAGLERKSLIYRVTWRAEFPKFRLSRACAPRVIRYATSTKRLKRLRTRLPARFRQLRAAPVNIYFDCRFR